jgi:hypothetical protein
MILRNGFSKTINSLPAVSVNCKALRDSFIKKGRRVQ